MSGHCNDDTGADGWVNGKIYSARRLTTMGVAVKGVAGLGVVANVLVGLQGVADMVLAGGISGIEQATRLVLGKKDGAQRLEVDATTSLLAKAAPPQCMWCGEVGHWGAKCGNRTHVKTGTK